MGGDDLTWADAPAEALVFDRGDGLRCAVNLGADPLPLPAHATVLVCSGPLTPEGAPAADTAVLAAQADLTRAADRGDRPAEGSG